MNRPRRRSQTLASTRRVNNARRWRSLFPRFLPLERLSNWDISRMFGFKKSTTRRTAPGRVGAFRHMLTETLEVSRLRARAIGARLPD